MSDVLHGFHGDDLFEEAPSPATSALTGITAHLAPFLIDVNLKQK